jgi:hypothetical protein
MDSDLALRRWGGRQPTSSHTRVGPMEESFPRHMLHPTCQMDGFIAGRSPVREYFIIHSGSGSGDPLRPVAGEFQNEEEGMDQLSKRARSLKKVHQHHWQFDQELLFPT